MRAQRTADRREVVLKTLAVGDDSIPGTSCENDTAEQTAKDLILQAEHFKPVTEVPPGNVNPILTSQFFPGPMNTGDANLSNLVGLGNLANSQNNPNLSRGVNPIGLMGQGITGDANLSNLVGLGNLANSQNNPNLSRGVNPIGLMGQGITDDEFSTSPDMLIQT